MREVRLYGHLAARFGRSFMLDVKSPAEAVRALCANFADFQHHLCANNARYKVFVGKVGQAVADLTTRSRKSVIKIVPVAQGAGSGFKIVLGFVLFVVGAWMGNPQLMMLGGSLMLGGIAQDLARAPKTQSHEAADNQPSYTFNGTVNTIAQGNPVPIAYGELIVGSQEISLSLTVDQLMTGDTVVVSTPEVANPTTGTFICADANEYFKDRDKVYIKTATTFANGTNLLISWAPRDGSATRSVWTTFIKDFQGFRFGKGTNFWTIGQLPAVGDTVTYTTETTYGDGVQLPAWYSTASDLGEPPPSPFDWSAQG